MKVIPIALQADYDTGSSSTAFAFRVSRPDGQVYGFTSADSEAVFDGVTYDPSPGLAISEIVQSASFAVDNLKLRTLHDDTVFTKIDIMAGVWKDSEFALFKYNHEEQSDGTEPVMSGVFGQPQISRSWVEVELRDVKQYGQQTVGAPSTKTCRNRLGIFDGINSWCGVDLSDFTFAGTVTEVVDSGDFFVAALTDADDYYGNGVLRWNSGANDGLATVVKQHTLTSDGAHMVLDQPMFKGIQVGDQFTVEAGCRKTREICQSKFDQVVDFNGEPDRPLVNTILAAPTPSV